MKRKKQDQTPQQLLEAGRKVAKKVIRGPHRRTTDQNAAHQLMLSCRRLDTAIKSGDPHRSEAARYDTVRLMAVLLQEFGLLTLAETVHEARNEFDGRHIENNWAGWECAECEEESEELTRHQGKLLCRACIADKETKRQAGLGTV